MASYKLCSNVCMPLTKRHPARWRNVRQVVSHFQRRIADGADDDCRAY